MLKSYFAVLIDAGVVIFASAVYALLFVLNSFSAESLDFYTSLFSVIYFSMALVHQIYSYVKLDYHKLHLNGSVFLTQVTCCFVFVCYSSAPIIHLFDRQHEAFEGLSSLWLLFAAIVSLRISYDELKLSEVRSNEKNQNISNNQKIAA